MKINWSRLSFYILVVFGGYLLVYVPNIRWFVEGTDHPTEASGIGFVMPFLYLMSYKIIIDICFVSSLVLFLFRKVSLTPILALVLFIITELLFSLWVEPYLAQTDREKIAKDPNALYSIQRSYLLY